MHKKMLKILRQALSKPTTALTHRCQLKGKARWSKCVNSFRNSPLNLDKPARLIIRSDGYLDLLLILFDKLNQYTNSEAAMLSIKTFLFSLLFGVPSCSFWKLIRKKLALNFPETCVKWRRAADPYRPNNMEPLRRCETVLKLWKKKNREMLCKWETPALLRWSRK